VDIPTLLPTDVGTTERRGMPSGRITGKDGVGERVVLWLALLLPRKAGVPI
jgi:hypothetical protein